MRPRGRGCAARFPTPIREDLLLLDDLLGIADPDVALPKIDPDARRRRLTALINAASLARTEPALYVIEDAHWIDEVSESMLADFLTVIPQTRSMVLITYRPEYRRARCSTGARCADDCAGTAERFGDRQRWSPSCSGRDPSVGEIGRDDRRAGRR